MNEFVAVVVSYLFVASVVLFGVGLYLLRAISSETARKVIHIGVIHWWLIAITFIETTWVALLGPVSFIVINALNVKLRLIPGIQRNEPNDFGTVYYAISLSMITFAAYEFNMITAASIALFVMGYGDGLAALIGKAFPSRMLRVNKSVLGSLTMLIVSFGVSFYWSQDVVVSIGLALAATVVEGLSPKGLDNLSVPFVVFVFAGLFL
jgi:phytol kinase